MNFLKCSQGIYFFAISFCLLVGMVQGQNPNIACNRSSDSLELIKFYQNFGGTGWKQNTNWLKPGKPINTWKGVRLNTQGCVNSLILDSNKLSGNLYDPLLPNLKTLSLMFNDIQGSLPDFVNLPLLDTLILTDNKLSGNLVDFQNLPRLVYLDVGLNKLTGGVPDFSKMPLLEILNIYDNLLTGPIPNFSKVPVLGQLWADGNQLSGEIPDFDKIPEMASMYLTRNNFSGKLPLFSHIPKIQFLDASFNQFTGSLPNFSNLPTIYILGFSNCNLSGEVPDFNFPKIMSLYLRNNNFSGSIPRFSKLKNLFFLELGGNKLTGSIPDFADLPELNSVWLYKNQLSGPIPNTPFIKWFHYWNNNFSFSDILASGKTSPTYYYYPQNEFFVDTTIQTLKNAPVSIDLKIDPNLKDSKYYLFYNHDGIQTLVGISDSNKIVFAKPQFSDAGRYQVQVINPQLPKLGLYSKTISLRVCDRQNDSLELLRLYNTTGGLTWNNHTNWLVPNKPINTWYGVYTNNLGCVQKIDLSNNNLKGNIPALNLNTLDTAIFQNNSLNGSIPEIKIPFIKELNLSKNQLSGEFPNELINWTNIQNLNVSKNLISGAVPPDLGDLCELRNLKMDNNKIKGELPVTLTQLNNLQVGGVDFSQNAIDSLQDKMIWFCPFGDTIFKSNPSYDRFLGICNVKCNGNEFNSLKDFPWIQDTIDHLSCKESGCELTISKAGFVDVRGIKVFYTRTKCYLSLVPPTQFNENIRFFDCGGHLLENVQVDDTKKFVTQYMAITYQDFENLVFEEKWQCGQKLNVNTDTKNFGSTNKIKLDANTYLLPCSPNPAREKIICELPESGSPIDIKIVNLMGQNFPVPYHINEHSIEMNIEKLAPGMYLVSLQSNRIHYTAKIWIP